MARTIDNLSSEEDIYIYFIYQDGERDSLKNAHRAAFDQHSEFGTIGGIITTDHGDIEILTDYVSGITNMSYKYNYIYEDNDTSVNLWYSPLITYAVRPSFLYEKDDRITDSLDDEALDTLIESVSTGYTATDDRPIAIYVETPKHRFYEGEVKQPPVTAESLTHDEYACLSWLTVFTPPMVETYGRETLLSAPAYRIEELDGGAIILVCHDKPLDWDTDCRAVADHIGLPLLQDLM
ncbi:hypothetical protein [Halosolutus halophilus]|uniref:hypothetical protein n=1 Tax=Halosolutus halophilus TaxID=1552990 RepID=UPI0022350CCE|nr:hypothetical protein [Halosolutus halophilus]